MQETFSHPPPANRSAGSLRLILLAGLGILYLAFAFVTHRRQLPVLCPWRRLTGWRCPLCGFTTATGHALHGEWRAAQQAHPFIVPAYVLAILWFVHAMQAAMVPLPPAMRRS